MEKPTPEQVMEQMGFPATETGPYVTELRGDIAKRIKDEGLLGHSAGTWGPLGHIHELRAKELLASQWAIKRWHYCERKCFDSSPIGWEFNFKTSRWHVKFRPRSIAPWIGDRLRRWRMDMRIWRDAMLGYKNPYRD